MPVKKVNDFDKSVIKKINDYIEWHHLSHSKIAKAAGMSYGRLYTLRHTAQRIKLEDYVNLCKAFNEPLDKFL